MDLITTAFQVPQHSAQAGENLLALFNIDNVTDTLIEGVGVKFYLSRNGWISTGDYELGSYNIPSIAGNVQSGVQSVNLLLPPESDDFWSDNEDGTYYIGALIDNNNAIDLGSSDAYRQFKTHDAIRITDLKIPDLRGDHFSVSQFDRQADGSILATIDFGILNQGDGLSDSFLVDFYISDETDNRKHPISTDDYFIGSYEVGGLESGNSTGILSTVLNLPAALNSFWDGSGYYSLGMRINDSGDTHESRRSNNNSNLREGLDYSINTIFHESWVDLHDIIFDVRQEDVTTYHPGQNLTIDYAIRNSGLGLVAQDFNLDFYVSTDPQINTDDFFIGSDRFTHDLGAGAYGRGTADFILPDNFPAINEGRYFVGVIVDGANEVPEKNETNNQSMGELLDYDGTGGALDGLRNIVPDLTNSYFNLISGDYQAGGTVNVEFSAANISHVAANPFSVGIYISHNEYISTNDTLIGTYDFTTGLASYGDTGIIQHSVTLPDGDSEFWKYKGNGTYFIGTIIDPNNAHAEYKESNNSNLGYKLDSDAHAISGLTFTDLVGGYFKADPADDDSSLSPGKSVNIAYQIANQEAKGAGPFTVEFYLSSTRNPSFTPYISENDVLIGTKEINSLNGYSITDILNETFQLPDIDHPIWSDSDGTYSVGMIIDRTHQVNELSHLNNQNQGQYLDSDTIEVIGTNSAPDGPDLIGSSLIITDDVSEENPLDAGQDFHVEYSVINTNGVDTPFFANEFFIVEKDVLDHIQNLSPSDVDNHTIYGAFGNRDSALIKLGPYDYSGDIGPYDGSGDKGITLRVPDNISAGHYALVMQTDVFNEVHETNEFNNISYVDIYINSAGDLFNEYLSIVEDISEENPLKPGDFFTAEYEVVNKGGEDIPFFASHFYLMSQEFADQNFEIEFSDIEYNVPSFEPLFNDPYPLYGDFFSEVIGLGAGDSTGRQQITLQVPEDIEPGKYILGIKSDVFDEVDEPNEFNNSLFDITKDYVELYISNDIEAV
ncbi:MAG: CARDB domain-containing protein [Xenococcus sp. (in: cyanobacteria)]